METLLDVSANISQRTNPDYCTELEISPLYEKPDPFFEQTGSAGLTYGKDTQERRNGSLGRRGDGLNERVKNQLKDRRFNDYRQRQLTNSFYLRDHPQQSW